jgi:hypothetical protein
VAGWFPIIRDLLGKTVAVPALDSSRSSIQVLLTGMVAIEARRGHIWMMRRSGCAYGAGCRQALDAVGIPYAVA